MSDLFFNGEYLLTLHGMPKFDGTSSIDGDDSEHPSIFSTETVESWAGVLSVSFKEMANGKFAIARLFMHDGQLYVFGGSKNMHKPYEFSQPITGGNLHDDIMRYIFDDLKKLPLDQLMSLVDTTLVGEYVDGQHLVYVNTPYMVYFNAPFGVNLPVVKDVLPPSTTMPTTEQLRAIREMTDIEGVVIEYVNTMSGQCLRQKHKTNWYIIWRCWREQLATRKKGTDVISLMKTRLKARSDQYIHLSDDQLTHWYDVATRFIDWFANSPYEYADCRTVGMATLIHQFNLDEGRSTGYLENPEYYRSVIAAAKFGLPVVVVMVGNVESGRTIVANELCEALTAHRISVEVFRPDTAYECSPAKLKAYHAETMPIFKSSEAQVRIIDSDNLKRWVYVPYFANVERSMCIILSTKMGTKPQLPAYYGLFPLAIGDLVAKFQLTNKQLTPPHVTVHFVGGAAAKDVPPNQELMDTVQKLRIVGYSTHDAGQCLVTSHELLPGNHITLTTNAQFKPVDVGTGITTDNTVAIDPVQQIDAIYLPFF
jgi:hypothetical protein